MPNYQKTLIYKLICNDANITQFYVGHTTNFNSRIKQHKECCCNEKSKQYNKDKYKYIRANGGWNNWNMIEIEKYPCDDKKQASIRERYWIEKLNSNLNKCIPTKTTKEWRIENKDKVKEYYKKSYEKTKNICLIRSKLYRDKNKDIIEEKRGQKINCECGCIVRKDGISKHLKTQKHLDLIANKN